MQSERCGPTHTHTPFTVWVSYTFDWPLGTTTQATDAIAIHENRPEALHGLMAQLRLDAAAELTECQSALIGSKNTLRELQAKHTAANTSPELKRELDLAAGAVVDAEDALRESQNAVKSFDLSESPDTLLTLMQTMALSKVLVAGGVNGVEYVEQLLTGAPALAAQMRAHNQKEQL